MLYLTDSVTTLAQYCFMTAAALWAPSLHTLQHLSLYLSQCLLMLYTLLLNWFFGSFVMSSFTAPSLRIVSLTKIAYLF